MSKKREILLTKIFESWADEKVINILSLPPSGSYREYYRITSKSKTALGVYNPDLKENIAFIRFSKHFAKHKLNIPEIYDIDNENKIYLIQDLGDRTLFSLISELRTNEDFPEELINLYKKVIDQLPKFQIIAGKDIDYSYCYPRSSFDKQSMLWDLSYFKYYFLKLAKISFDEQKLEDDFHTFTNYLLQTETNYFLYRDFQSRNIMFQNNIPYFIDYQGGRKGALQYDIASLLFDAKADIPQEIRNKLLDYYIDVLSKIVKINKQNFIEYYYGYVIIRILQAMGAYGFRGFYEKKEHFLKSIPYSIINLKYILNNIQIPVSVPTLNEVLKNIILSEELIQLGTTQNIITTLKVTINSFSYKRGIPTDNTGNGGGFVFDCRAIPNPGKNKENMQFTGKDKPIIDFLEKENIANEFLTNVYSLIDNTIIKYQQRKFTNLMVNFGCTGGQHRSVYCAEKLAKHIAEKYDVIINLHHIEQENKETN